MRSQIVAVLLGAFVVASLAARIPRQTEADVLEVSDPETTTVGQAEAVTESDDKKDDGNTSYTSRFDYIDVDQILLSDRLVNNYFKCLMETGPCTPDGAELKRVLPDALATECSRCSVKQRQGSEKVIEFIIRNKPDQWKELQAKYDPKGELKNKYASLAVKKGFKI